MQIIYAECLIEKVDGCKIHSQKRVGEHVPSDFSVPITSSFKSTKNKYGVYRDKDCMKKFCEYLREHGMKIINFKGKKMRLLTNEQQKIQKSVLFIKKNLKVNMLKIKNIVKQGTIIIILENIEMLNIAYVI